MNSIELTAPAKVNLFLKVLNKRKDGYHDLLTVFERISLADRITISRIPKGIIVKCNKRVTAKPSDNIAYKAAELILKNARVQSGVKIRINKMIPIAAGLGGGSSDAAAVLIGINKLFDLNISKEKLMGFGAQLGADVPFFIFDTPFAVGRGIGDKLEKLNIKTKFYHILVYPGFKVATKGVYQALDLPLTRKRGGDRMIFPKSWNGLEGFLHNDLESVVIAKKPAISRVAQCLVSSLGRRAMVTGSGPSLFCLYRTRREAIKAKRKLLKNVGKRARKSWQIFIVDTKA